MGKGSVRSEYSGFRDRPRIPTLVFSVCDTAAGVSLCFWEQSLWRADMAYRPINRAAMVFMISFVPAKIRITRVSRQARAMGYSSQ